MSFICDRISLIIQVNLEFFQLGDYSLSDLFRSVIKVSDRWIDLSSGEIYQGHSWLEATRVGRPFNES